MYLGGGRVGKREEEAGGRWVVCVGREEGRPRRLARAATGTAGGGQDVECTGRGPGNARLARARRFGNVRRHSNVELRGRGAGRRGRGSRAEKAGQAGQGWRVQYASVSAGETRDGRTGATRGGEQEHKRSGGRRAILWRKWADGQRQAGK